MFIVVVVVVVVLVLGVVVYRTNPQSVKTSMSGGDERQMDVEEVMNISDADAAFVLGRGGQTKRKIARACGASLELDEKDLTVTMKGSKEAVREDVRRRRERHTHTHTLRTQEEERSVVSY